MIFYIYAVFASLHIVFQMSGTVGSHGNILTHLIGTLLEACDDIPFLDLSVCYRYFITDLYLKDIRRLRRRFWR